jgi:uncharacterized FlaG/YvyC family protein
MTSKIEPLSTGPAASDALSHSRAAAHNPDDARRIEPALAESGKHAAVPGEAKRALSLRFKVDPDTQEVRVLMVDTATRRVVRTIPPDELKNLAEGELVELFA